MPPAFGEDACFLVRILVQQPGVDVEAACCLRYADDGRKSAERVQFVANLLPVD
ncbi:hypothetical protein Y025_5584 [Burkholderia pseudomallei TSV32]|nr:hypothetical protein Y025_5584 [Burkholderia pseudomallei TSV32]